MKDTKPLDLRNCSEGVYIQVKGGNRFSAKFMKNWVPHFHGFFTHFSRVFTGFSRTFHGFSLDNFRISSCIVHDHINHHLIKW